MKNIVLLLLLFSGIAKGQIITFTDPNLKARLLLADATNHVAENSNHVSIAIDTNLNGEIEMSEVANITLLSLQNANVSNLSGLEFFTNLQSLYTENCPLTTISLSANTQLLYLYCEYNQITSIDFNTMPHLQGISCSGNPFASLDLGMLNNLNQLVVNSCPNLTSLNLKNGSLENVQLSFLDDPNLRYICADENQLAAVNNKIQQYGYTECSASSYCSFTPGGNYNTITGNTIHDLLNDGCGNDTPSPYIKMSINDGSNTGSTFSNSNGTYSFYTAAGIFNVAPDIENPTWFNLSPLNSSVSFPLLNNSVQTRDFCIKANGNHPDLEVIFVPTSQAVIGSEASYKIIYRNKGNQVQSGTVNLNFNNVLLPYLTASPTFNVSQPGLFTWNYANLKPFETRTIDLTLILDDLLGFNVGDVLTFTANTNPISGEETPTDNASTYKQILTSTAETNQTICIEGHAITPAQADNYLHYNINFENTGTAEAVNVVVKDSIDITKFKMGSFRLLYASAPVETKITDNVVEFIFKNIHLQPGNGGPIGGHGNVLFKIEPQSDLALGTEIIQDAQIYFDYNLPIPTNQERTTVALMGRENFTDTSVCMVPNPATDFIEVTAKNKIKALELFDGQGRILETHTTSKFSTGFDLSTQTKGVYFLKIYTEKGSSVQKIIKE